MSKQGKYPFEGTPNLEQNFKEVQKATKEENQSYEAEDNTEHDSLIPVPKPSWAKGDQYLKPTEQHMPHIFEGRQEEKINPQEDFNYTQISSDAFGSVDADENVIRDREAESDVSLNVGVTDSLSNDTQQEGEI